ncbi:30S ribosomal protein S4 [Candidatus Microgenomates bacterium]|nr:30S ribosomal protein S4 [Candidatus Microgenomates bacterium]
MARYTGPKDRLSRREGFDLFGVGNKLTRLAVPPGQHGPRGVSKLSGYGRQLREKQKTKRLYGVLERQFKQYVERASRTKGNSGEVLLSLLERRLDNTVYRLGFAPTRPAARQLVVHGHVFVNGKRSKAPSLEVRTGDVITLSARSQKISPIAQLLSEKDKVIPSWLERKGPTGKIARLPLREDVIEPIEEQTITEFYSR